MTSFAVSKGDHLLTGCYTYLSEDDWNEKIDLLESIARKCTLCPRQCRIDRLQGERGFCGAPSTMVISSIFAHHGEEPPISGISGSGTVFFSYCTLKCCFCQNFQISHDYEGKEYSEQDLAIGLLRLQDAGCHNINLVTATHFLPWIFKSIKLAARSGLQIPIVYNCGGYERVEIIKLLDGVVDIFLPDMKYGTNLDAEQFSHAFDYVEFNRDAIREMFRQVGPLRVNNDGIARRGLCIRHLVLPGNIQGSSSTIQFLKDHFDPEDISISLMAQYNPLYKAKDILSINRKITEEEYEVTKQEFIVAGFDGFFQEFEKMNQNFIIDFTTRKNGRLIEG
jgi:putative pyruvate formate lyase activating enzyme